MFIRCFFCLWLFMPGIVFAEELPTPTGDVLLTISGNIEHTNSERGAEFDLEMLKGLQAVSITTDTPWTDDVTVFEGVSVAALLQLVGAKSTAFRASALDNYWYDVSNLDFEAFPIIIAYKRDGSYMSTRNLGPLWLMFPFDDYPELLTEVNKASSVWQLDAMIIQ